MTNVSSSQNTPSLLLARVFVFCASLIVMLVELTASRFLAPYLGSSLYTWTSVIFVMLLGYTVGAVAGGRLADKFPGSKKLFAATLGLSGVWVGLMPWIAPLVGGLVGAISSLLVGSLVFCIGVFFPAAFLLSLLYPQVVKFRLRSLSETGRVVAGVGMWNAAGSILGTYLTGFVLLQYVSLPVMCWVAAGCLLVLAGLVFVKLATEGPSAALRSAQGDGSLQEPSEPSETIKYLPLCVFVTGFVLMSMQILSGRMMAPFLGYSIYTWTSAIGATLLGITLGYHLGGRLADTKASRSLVAGLLGVAGIFLLIGIYTSFYVGGFLESLNFPLPSRTFFFAILVFFPPTFFLSMVTPIMFRFAIRSFEKAARRYGSIGAWSALGNMLGVVCTGYFLISLLGTRLLSALMAVSLFGLAIAIAPQRLVFLRQKLTVAVVALLVGLFFLPRFCEVESNYFCILKVEGISKVTNESYKILRLDHLVHSYVTEGHPERLGYGYEQVYASLIASRFTPSSTFSSFFIGGGGYVMPRYLEAYYPVSTAVVGEIDPAVTTYNHTDLWLSPTTSIQTVNEDARFALMRMSSSTQYDLVFGDAFNDFGVPFHLTTEEFHRLLKTRMKPEGVYALNIIDDLKYGSFFSSMVTTVGKVWKHVYVVTGAEQLKPGRNTIVILASDVEISEQKIQDAKVFSTNEFDGRALERKEYIRFIAQDEVTAYVAAHPVPALTDGFVPLDRYLAKVFQDAY